MANIINAIMQLVTNPKFELKAYSESHNRANNMGEALEEYIKDIFAGTVNEKDENTRNQKISEVFSYLGNQNNPPDCLFLKSIPNVLLLAGHLLAVSPSQQESLFRICYKQFFRFLLFLSLYFYTGAYISSCESVVTLFSCYAHIITILHDIS